MAASIVLIDVRVFDFQIALSYFISDFDLICGRLHG